MSGPAQNTINYFSAPENYFWRWAEGGEVIEWVNGVTICYRDELADLMKGMGEDCLPPLSCILLVLAACHENWSQPNLCTLVLADSIKTISKPEDQGFQIHARFHLQKVLRLLKDITSLPGDLKKGQSRKHLLRELFENRGAKVMPGIIEEFSSGNLHQFILENRRLADLGEYTNDLQLLADIRIPDPGALQLKLRTGITELPQPLQVEVPNPKPLDLLEELAAESKTAGIARLSKRIIAALNIPMHSQGSSDQPYGGISDITNRGSFDRLLLSELAHDDVLLMARLVNNEALYLRREEPPYNPKKQRAILIDTSIKMWGLPRIFAVSAAIACTLNTKHREKVGAFLLGGDDFIETSLSTKEDVVKTLEKVDNGLYCTGGLEGFLQTADDSEQTDVILITHDAYLHSAVFQKLFSQAGAPISFIISVNRSGEMVFNEVINNNIKKLSSAKFDLEELLSAPTPLRKQKTKEEVALPIFYSMEQQPLYFPTTGMRMGPKNIVHNYYSGLYGVTETQRLLHWPKRDTGASELLRFIDAGEYCFGFEDNVLLYVLVKCSVGRGIKLYKTNASSPSLSEEFTIKADVKDPVQIVYFQHHFYIKTGAGFNTNNIIIDCIRPGLAAGLLFDDIAKKSGAGVANRSFNEYKKFINNGYNVFHRVHEIFINSDGHISLDYNTLYISATNNDIQFANKKLGASKHNNTATPSEAMSLRSNPNTWLRKYTWPNGSHAVIDSNGLVHFKSANTKLPEVAVVMVLNKPAACWSADGAVCGADYFTGANNPNKISAAAFYPKYIRAFIENLEKK